MSSNQCLRAYLPWICTSLALGYAAYLHWKLSKQKSNSKKINDDKKISSRHEVNIDNIDRNGAFCENCTQTNTDTDDDVLMIELDNDDLPNASPEQIKAGFSLFMDKCLEETKQEPSAAFAQECAKKWKMLSPDEKRSFNKRALNEQPKNKDKIKFEDVPKLDFDQKDPKIDDVANSLENVGKIIEDQKEVANKNEKLETEILKQENNSTVQNEPIKAAAPLKRKRFSLKGDLDDLAFDIFCADEIIKIREASTEKMSEEEILDELTRRWVNLSSDLKEDFLSQAAAESSIDR